MSLVFIIPRLVLMVFNVAKSILLNLEQLIITKMVLKANEHLS